MCDFWIVLSGECGLFGIVVRCICMCVLFLLSECGVRLTVRIADFMMLLGNDKVKNKISYKVRLFRRAFPLFVV